LVLLMARPAPNSGDPSKPAKTRKNAIVTAVDGSGDGEDDGVAFNFVPGSDQEVEEDEEDALSTAANKRRALAAEAPARKPKSASKALSFPLAGARVSADDPATATAAAATVDDDLSKR
jgi:hypothetical protein